VPRSQLTGDAQHSFEIPASSRRRYSHVRLRIFPDGGVARLRAHGVVVPDPALLEGLTFDLAALENGGDVVACSDRFYSAPRNAISPGLSRVMGEGWETRRRRAAGLDEAQVAQGDPRVECQVELTEPAALAPIAQHRADSILVSDLVLTHQADRSGAHRPASGAGRARERTATSATAPASTHRPASSAAA